MGEIASVSAFPEDTNDIVAYHVFNYLLQCALSAGCVPPYITHMGHRLFTAFLPLRLQGVCISSTLGHVTLRYASPLWSSNAALLKTQPQEGEGLDVCFKPIIMETPELSYSADFFPYSLFIYFFGWKE